LSLEENQENPQSLEDLPRQFREIWSYAVEYLDAKWDLSKASFRDALLQVVLWSILTLLGAGVILIAVSFVFYGMALALGEALGQRPWAGYLIAGGTLLLVFYLLIHFKIASAKRKSLREKTEKYERKLEEQRRKFGLNAVDRAAAAE
jgi:type VI protein secretion system component VasK